MPDETGDTQTQAVLPKDPGQWADLKVRVTSGLAIAAVGITGIILGGVWFQMMAVFVTAVMIWELWMMIEPGRPTPGMLLAAFAASVLSGMLAMDGGGPLWLFFAVPLAGLAMVRRERTAFLLFSLGIQIAGWELVILRGTEGFAPLLWLVLVVAATDIGGYFAGRRFGGPKFWPSVSPKKTWSGTVAGWIAAGVIGLIFMLFTDAGAEIIPFSMALSFAGQMGDIAESALKRRQKVKDSSTLIPGHGGLFDRFDALLGASLFLMLVTVLTGTPGVQF